MLTGSPDWSRNDMTPGGTSILPLKLSATVSVTAVNLATGLPPSKCSVVSSMWGRQPRNLLAQSVSPAA